MGFSEYIKKFVALDVIFGTRTKKLAGINDKGNTLWVSDITFTATTITCTGITVVPAWMQAGKYFRVNLTGYSPVALPAAAGPTETPDLGTNHYVLFRCLSASIVGTDLLVTLDSSTPATASGPSAGTLDGRIHVAVNDPLICRMESLGSTSYNVHVQSSTGLSDGSGVDLAYASHYHTYATTDQIVTHELGSTGNVMYASDPISGQTCALGPFPVCDNDGNVVWF